MQVELHIRPKYVCPACDGEEGMSVVRIAPMPPQIIPHGMATPSLLAQVITAKFVDSIPFYRQTKQIARLGGTPSPFYVRMGLTCRETSDPLNS